jgi:hypothetical protein
MRGLDPRICPKEGDGRVKPGHDVVGKVKLDSGFRRNDDLGRISGLGVFANVLPQVV